LLIYDLESDCEVIAEFERGKAHSLGISDVGWFTFDSNIFSTASIDQSVKIWDSNTLDSVITWRMNSSVNCIAIPKNQATPLLIAVGMDERNIRMCDLKSGASTHTLKGHGGSVLATEWSPHDPNLLASGSSDGYIKYWDIRKASPCLKSLDSSNGGGMKSHNGAVKGFCFTSDGLQLVSVGADKVIRLWDAYCGLSTGVQGTWNYCGLYSSIKPIITHSSDTAKPTLFLPNNKHIQEFDLLTLNQLNNHVGHYGRVNCIAMDRLRVSLYSVSTLKF
jgi:DNA excision repair protein ERCC-8